MTRSGKRTRRLTIDDRTYLWSLRHTHHALADGTREGCCETLSIRSLEGRGGLQIQFSHGPRRLVPDGYPQPSGTVGTRDGRTLNLHEPGTVRALLDEAVRRGRNPGGLIAEELDGWTLFDAVHKAISLMRR
ncbi:hypothetical protein ACIQC7_34975 [Kitasatospora sp. NPDC088556]|uniref:hypothetical protein n=1 Tax=Kitasatospora sp. NPDC088556 TaxID=3364076 RepID=UPI00382B4C4B